MAWQGRPEQGDGHGACEAGGRAATGIAGAWRAESQPQAMGRRASRAGPREPRSPEAWGGRRPSPCWPGSGGSSSRARGSRARSSCTPPRSKHRAHLQPGGRGVSGGRDGVAAGGGPAGRALTSDDLHVEPQPPQGFLRVEAALDQLIQCLGEQEPLPTCSPLGTSGAHTPAGRGRQGRSHHRRAGTSGAFTPLPIGRGHQGCSPHPPVGTGGGGRAHRPAPCLPAHCLSPSPPRGAASRAPRATAACPRGTGTPPPPAPGGRWGPRAAGLRSHTLCGGGASVSWGQWSTPGPESTPAPRTPPPGWLAPLQRTGADGSAGSVAQAHPLRPSRPGR